MFPLNKWNKIKKSVQFSQCGKNNENIKNLNLFQFALNCPQYLCSCQEGLPRTLKTAELIKFYCHAERKECLKFYRFLHKCDFKIQKYHSYFQCQPLCHWF